MVVQADKNQNSKNCQMLRSMGYQAIPIFSLKELRREVLKNRGDGIVIDLDTIPVDNSCIKQLRAERKDIQLIALSERTFHPELSESIGVDIYACLGSPPDFNELSYCLKGTLENKQLQKL